MHEKWHGTTTAFSHRMHTMNSKSMHKQHFIKCLFFFIRSSKISHALEMAHEIAREIAHDSVSHTRFTSHTWFKITTSNIL